MGVALVCKGKLLTFVVRCSARCLVASRENPGALRGCVLCLLLLHSALDVVARRAVLKYAALCCSRRWAASVPALRSRTGRSGGVAEMGRCTPGGVIILALFFKAMVPALLFTPPEATNTGRGFNRGSGGGARGCGFEERVGAYARPEGGHFL